METYVTLSVLLVCAGWFVGWLLATYFRKEKKHFDTLNLPLKNKGKWWY